MYSTISAGHQQRSLYGRGGGEGKPIKAPPLPRRKIPPYGENSFNIKKNSMGEGASAIYIILVHHIGVWYGMVWYHFI